MVKANIVHSHPPSKKKEKKDKIPKKQTNKDLLAKSVQKHSEFPVPITGIGQTNKKVKLESVVEGQNGYGDEMLMENSHFLSPLQEYLVAHSIFNNTF